MVLASHQLREDLHERGPGDSGVSARIPGLILELYKAGAKTKDLAEGEDGLSATETLALHVRYWSAIERIGRAATPLPRRSSASERGLIADYDAEILPLAPEEFLAQATGTAGASHWRVTGLEVVGHTGDQLVVDTCQVVGSSLAGINVDQMYLEETLVSDSQVKDFRVRHLEAGLCAFTSASLKGEIDAISRYDPSSADGNLDFAIFRGSEIEIAGTDCTLSFRDANLGYEEIDTVDGVCSGPNDICLRASVVSFAKARLTGATIHDSEFGKLDVTDADLAGATFRRCKLAGRALVLDDLADAADFAQQQNTITVVQD